MYGDSAVRIVEKRHCWEGLRTTESLSDSLRQLLGRCHHRLKLLSLPRMAGVAPLNLALPGG
jgi:hypothetical protein